MDLVAFFRENNIKVLRDDVLFVRKMLNNFSYHNRKRIFAKYCSIWLGAMHECIEENKKENVGRKKANYWLLTLRIASS